MFQIFSNKVVANAFWLLSAQFLTKAISFGYNIFLARSLGPNFYGLFIFGLTIFGIVSAISDFGLARFLTRDLAKKPAQALQFTSQVFTLTGFLSALIIILLIVALIIFDKNYQRMTVGVVMLATVFPNTLAQIFQATFVALEKFRFVAQSLIFLNLAVTLFGVVAVFVWNTGVTGVVIGFLLAHSLYLLVLYLFLLWEKISLTPIIDFKFWLSSLKSAVPYGILTFLGLIYFRIDFVLLTYLRGVTETGFYGAAYRFLDAVQFIPIGVSTVLFPIFVRLHENSINNLKKIYFKTLSLLAPVGIVITIALFLAANFLIDLIYGADYQPSILALKILAFAIFFQFIHVPGAYLLFATEKFLKQVLILSVLTVSFNLIANLIFIPLYGFAAAAFITLISEILSFVIFFSLIWFGVFRNAKG